MFRIFYIYIALLAVCTLNAQSGREIYSSTCKNCHGINGEGIPPAIPPLADSDFLQEKPEAALKAVLEGLSGKITVNGKEYNSIMPAVPLNDENVAKVMNFVRSEFNEIKGGISAEQVKEVRLKTKYPTYEKQLAEIMNIGLPEAPAGTEITLAAELNFNPTRIIDAGNSQVLILSKFGDVYSLNLTSLKSTQVLSGKDYLTRGTNYTGVTKGIALDQQRRLYITNDYIDRDKSLPHDIDRVRIFRTKSLPLVIQKIDKPKLWYEIDIPAGVGPYNHGISHIEQGLDNWMYVSFGSRTNAGEKGNMKRRAQSREHELSAAIWRLKDKADKSIEFEVFARGFRNPYGFCWDKEGRLFASENGPDKDIEAELNLVKQGKHYGFPYQFADLNSNPHKESPLPENGLQFVKPLKNIGPGGITPLEGSQKSMATFTAHCVPVGMAYLDERFPEEFRDTMLLCRFGGFWPVNGITTGFDILQIKYEGNNTISSKQLIKALARPVDVCTSEIDGKPVVVIAEYCRGRTISEGLTHPGRILILSFENE